MRPNLQKMKEVALTYLDRSGGLQKFVEDCKLYNDSKQSYAVFRFLISINPSDIAELDATLGNYILHEPVKATKIFQTVCFTAVKTLTLIQQLQTEAQMNVVLKLTYLPSLPCYTLNLCKFPFDYMSQRFYMSEGIVIQMTAVTKYTQGARFVCSEETCPFSEEFQYIRVHTPGATESATVRNDFVCSLCSSPLQEDIKYRVLGDKQIVEMIDIKAMNAFQGFPSSKKHVRFQSFTVFLRDELVNKMKIGNRYKVIGIPVCMQNGSQLTVCLEANSVLLPNLQVLESRAATVFIQGKKYGEDIDQQISLPIQTSFWSFIDVDSCSRKHTLKDDTPVGQTILNLTSANLIDAFGLLIHCTEPSLCHSMLPVVNFIFKNAVDPEEASYVVSQQFKTQDYEEFLAFAKNLHVELGSEAEKLIHGYYLASRRVRTHSIHGSDLSTAALKVLISLSEAHAKLSLRTKVLEEDALIAILLYESSLTLKHGASVFCVPPNAVFPFELNSENSLAQRDVYLMQCHQHLMQFIATYGPAAHIVSSED
ncbi:minichromosome maintenance domain-containing protein 2 isoform X2 [Heteronotia binoei]|uniref:minichromosome maintenance domain-containing protein 2 isoform X2 n=1 Tax=Heteronotia binoei TaxID=13085 RepID=UPI0029316DE5|nr:minichromosome maintenance domain-containing protein 2 isoform X2 [Heteronotia binoei]